MGEAPVTPVYTLDSSYLTFPTNRAITVLIFVDDFSCFTWIYFLKKKYKVFQHFKYFKALVETQSKKKIKFLQMYNREEYVNHKIHNIFHEAWIQL